jgi:hypothetical protein
MMQPTVFRWSLVFGKNVADMLPDESYQRIGNTLRYQEKRRPDARVCKKLFLQHAIVEVGSADAYGTQQKSKRRL